MENRYDKYKDSGIAWIGEIPEHWEVCSIKQIMKNKSIKGFPNETVLSLYRDFGVIPKDSRDDNHNVTSEDTSNYKLVENGDFVINKMKAWQGSMAISDFKGIISPAYYICKIFSPKVVRKYIHYLLRDESYKAEYMRLSTGMRIGQWDLNIDDFLQINTILPSLSEQQYIATYLDQKCGEIDELITLQEGMITKLQSYKQSVITEAVTKGLDKNVPLKDSGIEWVGEIPKHWEVKRLKNVCSTNNASLSDRTSKEFEFDYVDIGSVSFELGIHKTEKYTFQNAPSRARKIARLGDIIVSTVRTYLRAIDIINSEEKEKYIYSTGFAILSPLKNILSEFMIYICRSEYFTNQVSIYSTGINYPSINDTALKMIYIVMPPLSEQQSIANYLDQKCSEIDELISIKQQKIEKLKDYKKSLIFECVTGKRKV
mgnify:FL=1